MTVCMRAPLFVLTVYFSQVCLTCARVLLYLCSPFTFHRFASLLGYTEQQFSESVAAECARRMDLKQAKTIWW